MACVRKRGKSYQIVVSNGRDVNGKQIMQTTTFTPDPNKTEKQNKKALDKFVREYEERVKSGKYLDGEKLSFKDFSEIWLRDYAEQQLEETTLALYRHLLKLHILPAIGHLKLSKIQPIHLNKLYGTLATERKDGKPGGYSPKTIKHTHNLISALYSAAVRWNITTENPCSRVEPPKQTATRDKIKFFTLEESEIFLSLLDKDYTTTCRAHDRIDDTGKEYHVAEYSETRKLPTQFKLFFLLALYCGMRHGEILALEWSDLNFNDNSVSITKSTTIANGKPITKAPKTASSIRTISVPVSVMEVARDYHKEQLQYRLAIGSQWEGENFIFIQANGRQMHPDTPYKVFKKTIRRHNANTSDDSQMLPEIPLHGLRHTSATLLLCEGGVNIANVSRRLGHSKASVTLDVYSHAIKALDKQAAEILDNVLDKKA